MKIVYPRRSASRSEIYKQEGPFVTWFGLLALLLVLDQIDIVLRNLQQSQANKKISKLAIMLQMKTNRPALNEIEGAA